MLTHVDKSFDKTLVMASIRYLQVLSNPGIEANIMVAMVKDNETIPERKIAIKQYLMSTPEQHIQIEEKMLTRLQGQKGIARLTKCPAPLNIWQLPLEYAEHGDFVTFMEKLRDKKLHTPLTRRHIHQIFDQLLNGVNSILSLGYVHRDIKPDNILVYSFDENNIEMGIADFGLAIKRGQTEYVGGTSQYIPPRLKEKSHHTYTGSEDVYAIGTTLVLLMSFMDPVIFEAEKALAVRVRISTLKMLPQLINDLYKLRDRALAHPITPTPVNSISSKTNISSPIDI